MSEIKHQLVSGIGKLGIAIGPEAVDLLLVYLEMLRKWNKTYNLTAITQPVQMVTDHLLDALSVLPYLPSSAKLIDIGTGGGIPGMILGICLPEVTITLLDSNQKKTTFLRQAVIELGLKNVTVASARAEAFRERDFDIIISRAFATLSDFVAVSKDLIAPSGRWFAMKGKKLTQELEEFKENYPDCEIEKIIPLSVPGSQAERHLMIIKQTI